MNGIGSTGLVRLAAIGVCLTGMVGQVAAASLDALQGAWTSAGTECADTFKKSDGKIVYKDRTSTLTTGLLVEGNRILGPNTTCTAERVRQEKDHLVAYLNCADAIMFGGFSASFRIVDPTHFERIDNLFPELAVTYQKCEL